MIFKKMKLTPSFYCHVLTVARDGLLTIFPTKCVMSSGHIHRLPILPQSSSVPSDILVSASMVYIFLCMGMCVYISIQHKILKLQKTWLSFWPGFLPLADSARPFLSTVLMADNGRFHDDQPFTFSSLSPCAGFLFCFSKGLFLASLGPGWSWTCYGPLIVLPPPPEYCDAGTHPTPSLCGSEHWTPCFMQAGLLCQPSRVSIVQFKML